MRPDAPEVVSALLPELVLVLGAVAGLLAGSFLPRQRQYWVRIWGVAICAGAAVPSAVALTQPARYVYEGTYAIDPGLGVTRLVVLASLALTLLLAGDTIAGDRRETEVVVLLLLAALGTIVLGGASDLLVVVAAFLLLSVPLYALTGYRGTSAGTEAALKQYLLGALAGVLLLVGVALLLGAGGGTDYATLATTLPGAARVTVVVGVVAVLAALAFELGAVPLHFWVPDVVQAAPAPVAAFTSTVPKLGAAVALARLLAVPLRQSGVDWSLAVAVVGAASMLLGALAALGQDDVRRLLGYSTVSQVGFVLMAVAVAGRTGQALPSLALYLAAYAVTNLAVFAVVCALPRATTLAHYRGLVREHRWLALALAVGLLGLVGTPPTAVFAGKVAVFTAAADGGLGWLVVVAAVATVASLGYTLRWLVPVFRPGPSDAAVVGTPLPWARAAALLGAVVSVLLGLAGGVVLDVAGGTPPFVR
ncbi:hypothetical protein GCM10027047_03190 [Rhodococcus aerolatus]